MAIKNRIVETSGEVVKFPVNSEGKPLTLKDLNAAAKLHGGQGTHFVMKFTKAIPGCYMLDNVQKKNPKDWVVSLKKVSAAPGMYHKGAAYISGLSGKKVAGSGLDIMSSDFLPANALGTDKAFFPCQPGLKVAGTPDIVWVPMSALLDGSVLLVGNKKPVSKVPALTDEQVKTTVNALLKKYKTSNKNDPELSETLFDFACNYAAKLAGVKDYVGDLTGEASEKFSNMVEKKIFTKFMKEAKLPDDWGT